MKLTAVKNSTFACVLFVSLSGVAGAEDSSTKSYPARGVVEGIAPDLRQVTIHHQAIPDYMMEMTMDFPVKDTNALSGISPGDKITFTLVVGKDDEWVENIRRAGSSGETITNKITMPMGATNKTMAELKPGDLLPDCALTMEDGSVIHFSDVRGKAVAFTFFYSRCPLPDYCPRMNKNFFEARSILQADTNAPANWQFISISFDPGFDTPETLARYANYYRGADTNRWLFAIAPTNALAQLAPQLDLMVMRDGENIMSHNLRTVVLDPQGKISHQFDGNQWTPQQLADAMRQAAREPAN
jgi:protein SCO1/2